MTYAPRCFVSPISHVRCDMVRDCANPGRFETYRLVVDHRISSFFDSGTSPESVLHGSLPSANPVGEDPTAPDIPGAAAEG